MERITISVSDEFAAELSAFVARHGYVNRSEAIRDLARVGLDRAHGEDEATGQCVATLSYVYDHHARDLPRRLTETHHKRHDLEVATLHVHLDHDNCLEIAVLKGDVAAVRATASAVISERGVRHGAITMVPVAIEDERHGHAEGGVRPHTHAHPKK